MHRHRRGTCGGRSGFWDAATAGAAPATAPLTQTLSRDLSPESGLAAMSVSAGSPASHRVPPGHAGRRRNRPSCGQHSRSMGLVVAMSWLVGARAVVFSEKEIWQVSMQRLRRFGVIRMARG